MEIDGPGDHEQWDDHEHEHRQNEMEEEADRLFAAYDTNKDGQLSIDEVSVAIDDHMKQEL